MISLIECRTGHRSRDLFLRKLAELPLLVLMAERVAEEEVVVEEGEEMLFEVDSLKVGLNLTDSYFLFYPIQLLAKLEVPLLFVALENGSFIHLHYSPQK